MIRPHERAALDRSGVVPIPFAAPAYGCPGDKSASGRVFGICHLCARFGGRGMEPAVVVTGGVAECSEFHAETLPVLRRAGETAERGATERGYAP